MDAPPSPRWVADGIRARDEAAGSQFDRLLQRELQAVSSVFWTPLPVAIAAAEWFDEFGVQAVVDIGSGAGKFCVAAALAGRASYTGLEQRRRLVVAARDLALRFEVNDRVRFVHGTVGKSPIPEGDAYYLFNPFGENLFEPEERLDTTVECGLRRYLRDVEVVEGLLRRAPVGTCLLTYNGFGGQVPGSYEVLRTERGFSSVLRLWRRARIDDGGHSYPADAP
jgi:SAM-dependent methyltransferase